MFRVMNKKIIFLKGDFLPLTWLYLYHEFHANTWLQLPVQNVNQEFAPLNLRCYKTDYLNSNFISFSPLPLR
jgi:hypothetical protein